MKMLTSYLRMHYIHGRGDSNEWGLFGGGSLFNSMGWDEMYQPTEAVSLDAARGSGPYDAAFFMPYQAPPLWMRDLVHGPIIAWIPDDAWRFAFTQELIASDAADHYITTCEEALPRYEAAGMGGHVTLSAFGTRPDFWPNLVTRQDTAEAKASFVGLCYGDRLARLQAIANAADADGHVAIDAKDTQRDVMPLAGYHQHMADSAFTLALTCSSHGQPQHKARLFEPQIHGSILVTEPAPLLSESWEPDVDCLVFTSPAEAQDKMRALLADPEAYRAMAERAYRRAVMEHSFQARFAAVFDVLGLPYQMPEFSRLLAPAVVDSAI